jgi:glycine hydroxymethyltransferase
VTSGVRLGSPAATSRGFGGDEFRQIGNWIAEVLDGLAKNPQANETVEARVREQVVALCSNFPIYPNLAY